MTRSATDNKPGLIYRLGKAARMGQDPIDRIWATIFALVIVVAASGLLVLTRVAAT